MAADSEAAIAELEAVLELDISAVDNPSGLRSHVHTITQRIPLEKRLAYKMELINMMRGLTEEIRSRSSQQCGGSSTAAMGSNYSSAPSHRVLVGGRKKAMTVAEAAKTSAARNEVAETIIPAVRADERVEEVVMKVPKVLPQEKTVSGMAQEIPDVPAPQTVEQITVLTPEACKEAFDAAPMIAKPQQQGDVPLPQTAPEEIKTVPKEQIVEIVPVPTGDVPVPVVVPEQITSVLKEQTTEEIVTVPTATWLSFLCCCSRK